jgi:hypothetical protein
MSEVREHSPFPQRTDLEDFGGPTFLSDVDSCDLELLQKSNKMGKKLTISMSGLVDSCDLELL